MIGKNEMQIKRRRKIGIECTALMVIGWIELIGYYYEQGQIVQGKKEEGWRKN